MAQQRVSSTDAVVDAATRVFLRKGYRSTTIDDIAREAGISKPTVYQYAESKQWLLDEIVRIMCESMERAQIEIYSSPAPAIVRLRWLIRLNVELAVHYRNSYEVTLGEQSTLSETARDSFRLWARRTTARFSELLTECQTEGSFAHRGATTVTANLILSMLTSVHRWFHPEADDDHEIEALVEQITELFSGVLDCSYDMNDWPMPDVTLTPTSDRDRDLGQVS